MNNVIDVVCREITTDKENVMDKQERYEELKQELRNLLDNAKQYATKETIVETVVIVGYGVKHIAELAIALGISIVEVLVEYIKKFVVYVGSKLGKSAAVVAEKLHKQVEDIAA